MLELKISCEGPEQAHLYLNAQKYHNLLSDLTQALRSAYKHGTDAEVLKVVHSFYPDLHRAVDHNTGAY
jgi:hypothetical protein